MSRPILLGPMGEFLALENGALTRKMIDMEKRHQTEKSVVSRLYHDHIEELREENHQVRDELEQLRLAYDAMMDAKAEQADRLHKVWRRLQNAKCYLKNLVRKEKKLKNILHAHSIMVEERTFPEYLLVGLDTSEEEGSETETTTEEM